MSGKYKTLWQMGFALVFLNACHSNPDLVSDSLSRTSFRGIINGHEVQNDDRLAKNTVLLVNRTEKNQYVCTATLLGGPFALTAAHCLDSENTQNMYVFFDTHPSEKSERRQVIAQKASPYWGTDKFRKNAGDIAVIKFEGDALPKGYHGVEFLENPSVIRTSPTTLVYGFGLSGLTLEDKDGFTLRKAVLPMTHIAYSATEVLLDQTQGSQVTVGDSGGPAYVWHRGKYYFWGLANREVVLETDSSTLPAVVFTNALLYRTWVQNLLRSL